MSEFPRDVLVEALSEQWAALDEVLSTVEGDAWLTPTALPGWTVRDIVSHIVGTETLLSGENPPETAIDVHTLPHVRNEIGALNERWVEGLRAHTGEQILAMFREITRIRLEALSTMTQEDFDAPAATPVGPSTYGRFMRIRMFDCWMHEHDIRDALGAPAGDEGGKRGNVAIGEIEGALGFIVGKLGRAPEGARVTLELSGPLARTIHVEVDGRAAVVPQLSGPATVKIAMDSRLFARLAGGRTTAAEHVSEFELDGDVEVGRRIVDNLAFTI
ncbi:maleylpyruvate isomerase family mycothiol-dependent enzyme [Rhodococcus spongiicola]|uniref:Maleylpyruvate isomerase family mycothiol-dependent enzyme n=1 Tax=Rhodococcus spongiicola TaxID=2487352 RepID=A0A3S3ZQI3_9NOCA|nr:maleylpyruvate isomerase family mycothiol-dependent enzyme [Rhodococcus spongiicola]RVW05973.1 maleylpyruvate isomerase family mycothiol-dependent enzyme [Rhodococcus spongiicola]